MRFLILLAILLSQAGCTQKIEAFSPASADHSVSAVSRYPNAVVPAKVGTYSGPAKSGAGYFYDEVLEYRVWLHPEKGAKPLAGDKDYFAAFAQYESALKFSETTPGAEPPLALVRQIESINEPSPGVYEWTKEERITEWQVEWLLDSHREPDSISKFLSKHGSPGK
ncbi:hypothetical protein [Rhodanobacter sp. B04]|uniref:hypothetical protein n=1 Tax=Rhodanobacter sp. B04 TaxID=1945860 RepID=UPI001C2C2F6A|nr:hypothetical protein [Rhodanobacter sp. B04]